MHSSQGNDDLLRDIYADVPTNLVFFSRWKEFADGAIRYVEMKLDYHTESRQFVVTSDRTMSNLDGTPVSSKAVTVSILNRDGCCIAPWDLHIGKTVDFLGRLTTLMTASTATLDWLRNSTYRMVRTLDNLLTCVRRFEPRYHPGLRSANALAKCLHIRLASDTPPDVSLTMLGQAAIAAFEALRIYRPVSIDMLIPSQ